MMGAVGTIRLRPASVWISFMQVVPLLHFCTFGLILTCGALEE